MSEAVGSMGCDEVVRSGCGVTMLIECGTLVELCRAWSGLSGLCFSPMVVWPMAYWPRASAVC